MNYDENQGYTTDMDGEAMPDLDRLTLPDESLDDDMDETPEESAPEQAVPNAREKSETKKAASRKKGKETHETDAEREREARIEDLAAKRKRGDLSESELGDAMEEMGFDIDSIDRMYESLDGAQTFAFRLLRHGQRFHQGTSATERSDCCA